ncbi:MAG: hypothetical protein ABIK89_20920 [Planctomycetota bacterium]
MEAVIAAVAVSQGRFYHEVLAQLGRVERSYGRRAAMYDLLLAHEAEQEKRKAQAEAAKKNR